ncbi:MAG: aminotransferase class I/II-fold pyridoxal phosphate-dependent enzyme [Planctomycetota bacterium]|nr:aminotransferase class I/II-fold pyridoxal phosphate-dependent enzyme [Planctomycetota bacterium]
MAHLDPSSNEVPASSVPHGQDELHRGKTVPHNMPLYLSAVWQCESTEQADAILSGSEPGFVYQRDGHPNATQFAQACRSLHRAQHATITSSGMAALSLAVLSHLRTGDHVVLSNQLYGRSTVLLAEELQRLGIAHTQADAGDVTAVAEAVRSQTKMIVVETIANPLLRVVNISALATLAHQHEAKLLVDNTFATPVICQPLVQGADLVIESVSKFMNGHGDIMLGMLAGNGDQWDRVDAVNSTWGLASSPLECWLACRGVSTLALRIRQACETAQTLAEYLDNHPQVDRVIYPGLESHPDYELARSQFDVGSGHVITFVMKEGRAAADRVMRGKALAFCPSLGDVTTTISHPISTSHRGLNADQQQELGITGDMIRLSVGIEDCQTVLENIENALKTE